MQIIETELAGVLVIEPRVFQDPRGFFFESYNQQRYEQAGIRGPFVQDNHSRSAAATLRGLHGQVKNPQGKLVRAVEGEVWDVAVDVRPGSATYGRWVGVVLSAENFRQIWVPPGFLHGFCVLSEAAQVEYKVTTPWDRDDEVAVAWNDPELAIAWPIDAPLLSDRDRLAPRLAEVAERLHASAPQAAAVGEAVRA